MPSRMPAANGMPRSRTRRSVRIRRAADAAWGLVVSFLYLPVGGIIGNRSVSLAIYAVALTCTAIVLVESYPEIAAAISNPAHKEAGFGKRAAIIIRLAGIGLGRGKDAIKKPIYTPLGTGATRAGVAGYLQVGGVAARKMDRQVVGEAAAGVHAVRLNTGA